MRLRHGMYPGRPRPALYRPGWIAALNKGSRCVFCWWRLALPRCAGCLWPHRRAGSPCSPLSAVRPASRVSMAGPRRILALSTPRRQGHARRGRAVHARLLEDLDAGFQRGAQFLPGVVTRYGHWIHRTAPVSFREEPFSASVTRPDCGESAYSHVTGQSECFREEAAPVCRRTCERHTRSLHDLLTCNAAGLHVSGRYPLDALPGLSQVAGG